MEKTLIARRLFFTCQRWNPKLKWFLRHPEGAMTLTNLIISQNSIGNQIGQIEKNSIIRSYRKPFDSKLKIQRLAEFCHLSCDMKFADPHENFESLCFKPTTQRNLKHKAPSVRALLSVPSPKMGKCPLSMRSTVIISTNCNICGEVDSYLQTAINCILV